MDILFYFWMSHFFDLVENQTFKTILQTWEDPPLFSGVVVSGLCCLCGCHLFYLWLSELILCSLYSLSFGATEVSAWLIEWSTNYYTAVSLAVWNQPASHSARGLCVCWDTPLTCILATGNCLHLHFLFMTQSSQWETIWPSQDFPKHATVQGKCMTLFMCVTLKIPRNMSVFQNSYKHISPWRFSFSTFWLSHCFFQLLSRALRSSDVKQLLL